MRRLRALLAPTDLKIIVTPPATSAIASSGVAIKTNEEFVSRSS
jgi:hypothetical protein